MPDEVALTSFVPVKYALLFTKAFVANGKASEVCLETACIWASMKGLIETIRFLVGLGVDIRARHNLAVCNASANGHLETVAQLVELGADVRDWNDCALCNATANGHLEMAAYLVELRGDIRACDDYALRGLHPAARKRNTASKKGQIELLEWWKESGLELEYSRGAMDDANWGGKVAVTALEWWKASGLELKYTDKGASWGGQVTALKWWK
ncbi:hypothetical protein DFJ77DRAFT_507695 [Powellomyces hirtus]|nr:hypothetical protein DFJ77DRAFT_507695 [Powellomyces hirtus]